MLKSHSSPESHVSCSPRTAGYRKTTYSSSCCAFPGGCGEHVLAFNFEPIVPYYTSGAPQLPHGVTSNLSWPVRRAEKITDLVRAIEMHLWPLTSKSINHPDPDCIGDVWNAFHWGGTSRIIRFSTEAVISVSWKNFAMGLHIQSVQTDEQKFHSSS